MMKSSRLIMALLGLGLLMLAPVDSWADISNAAVLYLRITPGARAAGMGDAFVAVADDATATHHNPAGLGAYPLADSWIEGKIPANLRPVRAIAALRTGGSSDYEGYEIWAITAQGLARFDNRNWYLQERFVTKTDQTVSGIVTSFFGVKDDKRLADMIDKVARANNREDYSYLEDLRNRVTAAIPADQKYRDRDQLDLYFDSLLIAYRECRVNWTQVDQITKSVNDATADNKLTETELDRVLIAVEKSRNRFVPEELIMPYSVNYPGEITAIAASEDRLLVGTNAGLSVYNGKKWDLITSADGLPSDTVLCLASMDRDVLIGTSQGPSRFAGLRLAELGGVAQLPHGPVTAIGARSMDNIWIVMDGQLYHFDGFNWTTTLDYKVLLDDTPERIAERFSVYGTPGEREKYLEQFMSANAATGGWGVEMPESGQTASADSVPPNLMALMQHGAADSTSQNDSTGVGAADTLGAAPQSALTAEPVTAATPLTPGHTVKAPFLSEIKGKVNVLYVGRDYNLWVGTEYGLLYFDGKEWETPGYRRYRIKPEDSFDALVDAKLHVSDEARAAYAQQLRVINDLGDTAPEVGRVVKIYRNPNATEISSIVRSGRHLYLGTTAGLVDFDGVYWARASVPDLSHSPIGSACVQGDGLWLAGEDKLLIKAKNIGQISLTHVKWLPELASDVYYEYLSAVRGSENWGTFGGNIKFITYGTMKRTSQFGDTLEDFTSFDVALSGSYGAALSSALKVGLSARIMYSKLSDIGTGLEKGRGTSTGFGVDFGLLYDLSRRLRLGAALTNLGPKMAYIDASQADDLPRNLALGFSYKLLRSDYYSLLVTSEMNKIMVGLNEGFKEELKQIVINSGAEFVYSNVFALRGGYIWDDEGDVKTPTLGVGLTLFNNYRFDFAYIPSGSNEALKNTLRSSLTVLMH